MKVLLLADHAASHTIKWATALSAKGIDTCIFSLSGADATAYEQHSSIQLFRLGYGSKTFNTGNRLSKLKYLNALPKLKKLIVDFQPDIVHAHYATSYGLLGALSAFHPFIISVWGSDVFDFPRHSFLHRKLLISNLKKADRVLSTSRIMKREILKYINRDIEVTPFGIDLQMFSPQYTTSPFDENDIVIGTIKSLEDIYGINFLIGAFALVKKRHPDLNVKLLIVGGGSQESKLRKQVSELGITAAVKFTGKVPFASVPEYANMLDIYVAVSLQESFGVAVIEASACEKPVVVSDRGGLPEVVEEGVTGFVVESGQIEKIAIAIEKLALDKNLRHQMGKNGRKRVKELYDWNKNVDQMHEIYRSLIP